MYILNTLMVVITTLMLLRGTSAGKIITKPCEEETSGIQCEYWSENIEGDPPYTLYRGQNVEMDIEYDAGRPTQSLTAGVYAIIGGTAIQWAGVPSDACSCMQPDGEFCPHKEYDYVHYMDNLTIPDSTPTISCTIKWILKDDIGCTCCAMFDVTVKS